MKYAVLFRGINVGGKNIVRMNDLKQLLLDLELENIQTYVQSGNAILEADLDEATLQDKIYDGFIKRFGFESGVIIRNIDEMQALIARLPFEPEEIAAAEKADPQVAHLYVYFLDKPPKQDQIDLICEGYDGPDQLRAGKREFYLLCHQSIRKAKLGVRMSKTFHSATVRNWKSICNLYDLLTNL
ncbi:MAG: DUF1697 domain-containing protein [Lachnospiraceae bacterium]